MTAHTGDAIFQAILDEPEDNTHRLVYADWLEEHGTTEVERARSELIRVQITRETADSDGEEYWTLRARERVLLAAWGKTLAGSLITAEARDRVRFGHGFVEEVRRTARDFNDTAAALFRLAPIRSAHLCYSLHPRPEAVAPLSGLVLDGGLGAVADPVPDLSLLTNLKSIGLRFAGESHPPDRIAMRVRLANLLQGPPPPRLRALSLSGLPREFFTDDFHLSPWLPRLESLALAGRAQIGEYPLAWLSRTPKAEGLRCLRLDFGDSHPSQAPEVGTHLANLRELHLTGSEAVLRQLSLPELRILVTPGLRGTLAMIDCPHLHTLELTDGRMAGSEAVAVSSGRYRGRLRRLRADLHETHLGALIAGARELPAGSQCLRELVIRGGDLTDHILRGLAASPILAGLTTLEIPGQPVSAATVLNLADPARSPRLQWLDVRGVFLGEDVIERLRSRLGAGLRVGALSAASILEEEGWI